MGGGQVSPRVLAWSPDGAEGCRTSLGYLGRWSTDQVVRWPLAFPAMSAVQVRAPEALGTW